MRRPARFLSCVVLLSLPGVAWAGGTAVVAPLVASGVDTKVSNNITSLISSELDFSGAYDTVNEIKAPSTLNSSCLTSTSCLGGIAKANEGDAVVTGSVAPGGAGLKINLVLYDAKKNAIVRKKSYDVPADVGTLASSAPKMVKEILGQGAALAEAEEESAAANVFEEEDEGDDFDMEGSDIKGKTRFTPGAKKGKLEDSRDEEEEAEAEAKAAAAAKAKAKADAEDRARREAEAKAKARAEAEAKAKAEAEAKAKAEAEERARREAEAKAKARAEAEAKAKAEAEAKAKSKKSSKSAEDEELEEELANFSFGGGGKVAEDEEEAAEEEEEEAPRDTRSFSERYASSTPSKSKSKAKVEEDEEEEEEEAPRASTKSKSTAKAKVEDDEEEEEEEEEAPRVSSRKSSDEEEEEDEEAPRASSRKTSDDEDEEETPRFSSKSKADEDEDEEDTPRFSSKSKSSEDEEEEDTPRFSSRSKSSDEDEDEPPKRSRSRDDDLDRPSAQIDEDAKARFGVLLRGGYAHFGTLDFVTYGAELEIPVASRVVILAGVEGASTNRNYTDEERKVIADAAGILPEQVQDWNAILPIDVGVVYKVPVSKIQPYIGADFLAVAYTAELDFAFGGRVRGGCDFMISDNFGFNVDAGVGVLAGDKFDLIQKDLAKVGLYPEISAGTVLAF